MIQPIGIDQDPMVSASVSVTKITSTRTEECYEGRWNLYRLLKEILMDKEYNDASKHRQDINFPCGFQNMCESEIVCD